MPAINGGILAGLWFGLACGMEGALNVGLFGVWLTFVASLLTLTPGAEKTIAKNPKWPQVPRWVDIAFDMAVIVLLVWYGRMWAGAAYTFQTLLKEAFRTRVLELRAKEDGAECSPRICKKCGVETRKAFCHACRASILYVKTDSVNGGLPDTTERSER